MNQQQLAQAAGTLAKALLARDPTASSWWHFHSPAPGPAISAKCLYCHGQSPLTERPRPEDIVHRPGCPIALAQQVLASGDSDQPAAEPLPRPEQLEACVAALAWIDSSPNQCANDVRNLGLKVAAERHYALWRHSIHRLHPRRPPCTGGTTAKKAVRAARM